MLSSNKYNSAIASLPNPIFVFFLLIGFLSLAELAAMALLPQLIPHDLGGSFWEHAILDAAFLAVVAAPVLWITVVRPMRRALADQNYHMRAIMDEAAEGILTYDVQGTVHLCNLSAARIFGLTMRQMAGRNIVNLFGCTEQVSADELRTHFMTPGRLNAQCISTCRNSMLHIEWSVSPFRAGNKNMYAVIVRDVTARVKAEQQLHETIQQLEAVFSSTHLMLAYLDADFNFIRVNQAYAMADQHEPDFYIGKNHFVLYPHAENEALFRKVIQSGKPLVEFAREFSYPEHPERGITYWDWSLHPVKDQNNQVTGLVLALVNVTDRRKAELAVEESSRNLNALLNATTETVLLLDTQGIVITANATAASRFKLSPENLVGQNVYSLIPSTLAEQRKAKMRMVIEQKRTVTFEDEREGILFETSMYPVFDSQGNVSRIALFASDITEKRLALAIETLFREINQQTLSGTPSYTLLNFVCSEVARLFGLSFAWVGRKEEDGSVSLLASGGSAKQYAENLEKIGVRWDDTRQGTGPVGSAIRSGEAQIFSKDDPRFQLWFEAASQFGFQSILSIPLIIRGKMFGTFTLYSTRQGGFDASSVVQRMTAIAGRLAVVLETSQDQDRVRMLVAALESTSNAIFITDRQARIEWANQAFSRLCGYSLAEVMGQNARMLGSGQHGKEYYRALWGTILQGNTWVSETVDRHKDGHLYTVQQTITPVKDESGEITHFISVYEDITEKKKAEARIRHMAQHDTLTGLPNRSLFYERLAQVHALCRRKRNQLALLFIDLDGFKQINDTHGHHAGDMLLQETAKRLKQCLRESDILSRLGGDEFTIILPDIVNSASATAVADKVIQHLSEPFDLSGHEAHIGASIGIAICEGMETEPDMLVKQADNAMYEAKRAGKNTYRLANA